MKSSTSNFSRWIFFLFGLSLPFPMIFNRITVGALLVYSVVAFYRNSETGSRLKFAYPGPWMLIVFFLTYLLTDLLSPSPDPAQVIDTYFLFPILGVIGLLNPDTKIEQDSRNHFLHGFLIGNVFSMFVCIIRAFYFSVKMTQEGWKFDSSVWGDTPLAESVNNYGNYFFSEFFSWFLHPSYASLYLELCLAYVFYLISSKKIKLKYGLVISGFLLLNLYLLSSRIAIFAILASLLFSAVYLSRSWKVKTGLLGFALISTTISLLNPRAEEIFSLSKLKQNERLPSWHTTLLLLKDNWDTGVGVTNVKPVLKEKYLELGYHSNAEQLHNAHNQFLETFLASGIIGLFVLFFMLAVLWFMAYQRGDYVFLVFCICMTLHFLVESMLSRHEGIVLFAGIVAVSKCPFRKDFT